MAGDTGINHPYPIVRSGGLFLALIGMGLIGAVVFSGEALVNYGIFYAGVGLAMVPLMFARQLSFGKPTRIQIAALVVAIMLEVTLFIVMGHTLPRGTAETARWMWVLMIVGVHFLPMAISFGPRLLVLGALCIMNALAGLLLSTVPAELSLVLDGVLKVAFGLWLYFAAQPTR